MIYVGIDLGGTNIAAGLVDESGKLVCKKSIPTGAHRSAEEIIKDMASIALDIVNENGYTLQDVKSIGIGCPGSVDKKEGVLIYANNLPFSNTNIRSEIQKYIDKPVFLENDANCAALAEAKSGAAKGTKNSVTVTLGTGVGGGVVINGAVLNGELGHMVIKADGEPCTCGRKGCWEVYASATALVRQTKQAAEKDKSSKLWEYRNKDGKFNGVTAFNAAKAGDKTAQQVVDNYVKYIGIGVANIINIFQPEVIVIGGGISNQGESLLEPVREYIKGKTYNTGTNSWRIEKAILGNDAGIIGAALLKG
ncbi:MAG: ROK family protein [Clostridia bacterium]|nr:ROK family protein [Clostridia bacterium]